MAVQIVALFASPAPVASRAFQRELAFWAIGVDVEAQSCGGVVDAIEEGRPNPCRGVGAVTCRRPEAQNAKTGYRDFGLHALTAA